MLKGHGHHAAAAQSRTSEIEQLILTASGRRVRVRIEPYEVAPTPTPAAADQPVRRSMTDHPLVRQAVEQLGARLVTVQPRAKQDPT